MSQQPRLRRPIPSNSTFLGAWAGTGSISILESFALAGVDFIGVDAQHGEVDESDLPRIVRALAGRVPVIARVAAAEGHLVERALDAGADGVIIPMVSTAADAIRIAESCRFPPHGLRSYGGRTHGMLRFAGDPASANDALLVIAMIETIEGVENIDSICATGAIDAVYIGVNDLALAMGLAPTMTLHPGAHTEAIDRIAQACARHGVAWGTHEMSNADRAYLMARGAAMISVCTDTELITRGARSALRR